MKTFTFNAKHLETLKFFTDKNRHNPTFGLIRFEKGRMIATDGMIAMIISHDQDVTEPFGVTAEVFTPKSILDVIEIEYGLEKIRITTKTASGIITQETDAISEKYPRVDSIIPSASENDLRVRLGVGLLDRIIKSAKKSKSQHITLNLKKDENIYTKPVRLDFDNLEMSQVVIMPMIIK